MNVTMKRCVTALGILAIASTAAAAQQASVGPKWQGWIGCWTASPAGESAFAAAPANGPTVCITPALGDAVDVTTVDAGKIVSTQRIDASGAERPVETKGCTGVQRATWSADERRIYLRSASTCDGLKSTTSAILAMTSSGEWLDVHGMSSYGGEEVRVARYRDAGIPATHPGARSPARCATAALRVRRHASPRAEPSGPTAVIEASHAADSAVVAAWLMEREQRFDIDAKTLVQLADAGVPGAVTDALVAVSNPSVFHVARATHRSAAMSDSSLSITPTAERRRVSAMGVPYDPWSWGYSRLRVSDRYGYGYGSLGYGRYGAYGYGATAAATTGGYVPPIIVVTSAQAQTRGQMVKGRGYTQTQGGSTGTRVRAPAEHVHATTAVAVVLVGEQLVVRQQQQFVLQRKRADGEAEELSRAPLK